MNVAVVVLALPQSSVAVKITVAVPVAAVVAQGDEVVAPSHTAASIRSCRAAVVGEPVVQRRHVAHAVALNCGVLSHHVDRWVRRASIVNVAVVVLALPQSSVAVKITGCSRRAAVVAQGNEVVAPSHTAAASEAVAPPLLASQSFNAVMLPMPSHSTVESRHHVDRWFVVSSIVNVAVVVLALPQCQ